MTNAAGFVSAAFFVDAIRARFGRSISLMIAQTLMICGYTTIVCTPPFPVVIASFFLLGFGLATNVALGNVFAVNLQNGTNMLGAMHGAYGIGGTIGRFKFLFTVGCVSRYIQPRLQVQNVFRT